MGTIFEEEKSLKIIFLIKQQYRTAKKVNTKP